MNHYEAYGKTHYEENKAVYIARTSKRQNRLYIEIIVPSKDKPCTDCGQKFPLVCMDFDHVRGEKKFDVALGYKSVSVKRLLEEIAKCDVVCSNCHRIRTASRRAVRLNE